MTLTSAVRSAGNLVVTVAVGPGVLAHEYAHYLACLLVGVEVASRPALRPFADDAVLEHERVSQFRADFPIAVAPFVANSALGFASFGISHATSGGVGLVALWLGVCFGLTSLPSDTDTATLFSTARSLPPALRPVGYALAAPVRAATWSVLVAGVLTFLWTSLLFATSRPPLTM